VFSAGTLVLVYRTNARGYDAAVAQSWRGPWNRIAKNVAAPVRPFQVSF
jgi:hypothetical protein